MQEKEIACVVRQPVSAEITQFAERLAKQASEMSERVNHKLNSVMTSDRPHPVDPKNTKPMEEYPPLFNDLRSSFNVIETALVSIEYALSRTEL